jgi:iron-sulfur cluster assembly accessory protein
MTLVDSPQINTADITLTPAAAVAIQDLMDKRSLSGYALRVFVSGGGCSGFQYGMALEGNIRENDLKFEQNGVQVVVDEVSITYMSGAVIDYIEDNLLGTGFKIDNPNAVSTCGCGSSFRTKDSGETAEGGSCSCH